MPDRLLVGEPLPEVKQHTHAVEDAARRQQEKKHAVAIADVGREGEIRYLGEIDSSPAVVERVIGKLAGRYETLRVCYEAGPTGYGLYRQVRAWVTTVPSSRHR
jgi:hypothetical protein